jgi:hypothetical protein
MGGEAAVVEEEDVGSDDVFEQSDAASGGE